MKKNLNRFCLVQNFSAPVQVSWAQVKELMKSAQVKNLCDEIHVAAEEERKKKKRQLPAITVHSWGFDNNKRLNENAWWNGLVCLEYDHLDDDEIETFRSIAPPYAGIILAGRSCSGAGIWMLIEVPTCDYQQMRSTLQEVHEAYSARMEQKGYLEFRGKVDIDLDLARLRFLPPYDYIFWDVVEDFPDKDSMQAGYKSMYADVIAACKKFEKDIPQGKRHNTYKNYVAEISKITNNTNAMLRCIPDLGLSVEERTGLVNWGKEKIPTTKKTEEKVANIHMLPIDNEALPFPEKKCPKLIKTLVKGLCKSWKKSATLCMLPSLSAACGHLSLQDGSPLAFQVALYGVSSAGKTGFSAKPAMIIQDYISRNDNEYRRRIARDKEQSQDIPCPKVLPFSDTSKVQIAKYLSYAKDQTVMLYEGDLSEAQGGKESSFLNLKKELRQGFDGESYQMDYKDENSFRGNIKLRLSALVIGTPGPIFSYFNSKATGEGNARRMIFVEHEAIQKTFNKLVFQEDELDFVKKELDYLQNIEKKTLFNQKIEDNANKWRAEKQEREENFILWAAAQTPTEMYRRTAYLMWALNHFDENTINDCCAIAKWLAEYQYRSYINNTYSDQANEMTEWQKRKAPSSQTANAIFNKQMLEAMPNVFTMKDIAEYRDKNGYQGLDPWNQSVVNRWKNDGLVAPSKNKTWVKI